MKTILLILTTFIFTILVSFADDNTKLTRDLYIEILPQIKTIHAKGSNIYYGKELKRLKYDWKGLSPTMIVVNHNNVDVMVLSKDSKIIRYNFNRFVGAWTPKKAIWVVNYHCDGAEREQIHLGGYILSDTEYKKDRLYNEYLQSKP